MERIRHRIVRVYFILSISWYNALRAALPGSPSKNANFWGLSTDENLLLAATRGFQPDLVGFGS
jgi:hypothetical protein